MRSINVRQLYIPKGAVGTQPEVTVCIHNKLNVHVSYFYICAGPNLCCPDARGPLRPTLVGW